jgi:hypothetical protein
MLEEMFQVLEEVNVRPELLSENDLDPYGDGVQTPLGGLEGEIIRAQWKRQRLVFWRFVAT